LRFNQVDIFFHIMLFLLFLSLIILLQADVSPKTVPLDFNNPEDQELFHKHGLAEGLKRIATDGYVDRVAEAYGQGQHLLECDEIDIPMKDHLKRIRNTAQAFRDRAQYLKFIQPVSQTKSQEDANIEIAACHKSYKEQYSRQLCIHERRRGVRCPGDDTELLPKHRKIPKPRQCRRIITKVREIEQDYKTGYEKYTDLNAKVFSGAAQIDLPLWKEFCFQELEVLRLNTEYETYLSIFKQLECREEISRTGSVPKVLVDELEVLEEKNKGKSEEKIRREKVVAMEKERLRGIAKEEEDRVRFLEADDDELEEDEFVDSSGKFKMDL